MRQKQRVGRYPQEFRLRAVRRVQNGERVAAVAADLGIDQGQIYRWRQQLDPQPGGQSGSSEDAYKALRKELQQVKQLLAEKTLEVDFFKGALQKIEARRRPEGKAGEKVSSPRLGK